MAEEETKTVTLRAALATGAKEQRLGVDTSKMKSTHCNIYSVQDKGNEVILNFGVSQKSASPQRTAGLQLLQRIILHPVTARRIKDTLVAVFKKRDERGRRTKARIQAHKKTT